MRRVRDKIGEPIFPSGDIKQCMLDERFLNFALKEIDKANVFAQSATATLESKHCFIKLLDVWPQLLQHELQTRPANVLHRLVRVRLPDEKSYRNPFATTDLLKAPSFFSQKLLESWNVAMAKRLVLQVKTAQLQEDRDQLGNLMRDAEALRGRLLVSPTSTYAESLGKILGELKDIRDSLKGARIVLRGSAFPEAVGLSSSTLLGAASSRETWLLPNEMRLLPLALEEGAHRFARVWIQQVGEGQKNVVRLQFLAELVLGCISKR